MITFVICNPDGTIVIVGRREELPSELELEMNTPEGGFMIDLTGQEPFDTMDILDIHNGYKSDAKKKKLIKIKE